MTGHEASCPEAQLVDAPDVPQRYSYESGAVLSTSARSNFSIEVAAGVGARAFR